MNDRALRRIVVSVTAAPAAETEPAKKQRDGSNRAAGFVITAASEIMAILSLAKDRKDLRARLSRIVVGADREGKPVTAAALGAVGPMMALLAEAIEPNLAQTTEGHARHGALRAVREHRARDELDHLAGDGPAAGRLRGE